MDTRRVIKRILPRQVLDYVRSIRNRGYKNLTPEQVFTKIYESGVWGKSGDPGRPFFSGSGSHQEEEVNAYVRSVSDFLDSLGE